LEAGERAGLPGRAGTVGFPGFRARVIVQKLNDRPVRSVKLTSHSLHCKADIVSDNTAAKVTLNVT
jgi:hypothetical protein